MIYCYWCTSAIGHTYTPTEMPQYSQLKLTYCSGRMPFYIFFPRWKKKYLGSQYLNNRLENCAGIFNFQLPPPPHPLLFPLCFCVRPLHVSQTVCRNVKQYLWERKIKCSPPSTHTTLHSHPFIASGNDPVPGFCFISFLVTLVYLSSWKGLAKLNQGHSGRYNHSWVTFKG